MTQPTPSTLFSPSSLCEKAMGLVGAFTPNDAAPDPAALAVTLEWMEILIAELAGVQRCQWLIPETLEFYLDADVASYKLSGVAGNNLSTLLLMYPIEAWIVRSSDTDTTNENAEPVDIIRRKEYEDRSHGGSSGTPYSIYINRLNDDPDIFVYPVPSDSTTRLRIVFQTYSRTVLANTQVAANEDGSAAHGFDRAWQNWLITRTAAKIGDGPVRKLTEQKITRLLGEATASLSALNYSINRERISTRLRRTKRYGG